MKIGIIKNEVLKAKLYEAEEGKRFVSGDSVYVKSNGKNCKCIVDGTSDLSLIKKELENGVELIA